MQPLLAGKCSVLCFWLSQAVLKFLFTAVIVCAAFPHSQGSRAALAGTRGGLVHRVRCPLLQAGLLRDAASQLPSCCTAQERELNLTACHLAVLHACPPRQV